MSDGIPAASAMETQGDMRQRQAFTYSNHDNIPLVHQECVELHPPKKKSSDATRDFPQHENNACLCTNKPQIRFKNCIYINMNEAESHKTV